MRTKSIFLIAMLLFGFWHTPSVFGAAQKGTLDQWANASPSNWQNGDLNPGNSTYREDYVVPYRAILTNLIVGHSYTLPIEFDTTKAGLHAQDFLKTYNATTPTDPCGDGVCPLVAPTTYPIPIDANVNNAIPPHPTLNYLPTDPAYQFTIWGGTITGTSAFIVSQGSYSAGAYSSSSSTSILVTFTANSTDVVLAWGGHLSTHSDWGIGQTAVNISGSPYHMRLSSGLNSSFHDNTDNTDSTLGNGDRSMKLGPDAFSSRLTVIKVGNPVDANTVFPFTISQPQGANCATPFSLAANGSSQTCNLIGVSGSFTVTEIPTAPGDYKWGLTNIVCTSVGDPPIGTFTLNQALPVNAPTPGSVTFSVNTSLQQDASCTFTNKHKPTLLLSKVVHNNFGGTAMPGDFNFHVSGTNVLDTNGNPLTSNDILHNGDAVIMDAGSSFTATEDSHYGYQVESVAGCSGTLNFNDVSTCTVTNKDVQPQLTVIKTVVNNSGGSAVSSDFTMLVNGTNVSSTSFAGSGAGTTVTLNQGSYGVTENGPPGYLATMVGCTGQIFVGDHVTCTITNDDIGPKIKVIKNTIGGNANFPISISSSNGPINTSILTSGGSGGNPYAQTPVPPTPGTGDTGYLEVAAGTVTVAEDLSGLQSAPAWRFTSVNCQDDLNTPVPIAVNQGTSVILNGLQLAHNYSCTFTNTQDASIPFIKKVNGTAPTCDPNTNVCTAPVYS